MSLKKIVQDVSKLAFNQVSDLLVEAKIVTTEDEVYDPSTGDISATERQAVARALRTDLKQEERALFKIQWEGFKLTFIIDELPIIPEIKDKIILEATTYKVVAVKRDVSDSLMEVIVGL